MNFQLKGFTLSTGDIWAYQKQRKADGKLNECSLIRHFGERCIVRSMSEQSSVGVLLLRRSEGSHELKMWFHCGMAEMVLCHGELQLQFHIVFILTWQQLSTCYTRFTSAKFFCSFIYVPPLHRPASLKNIYFLDFFCHYFSVSPRQLCFNFLWLKKPFSTSTYSTRLEGTRLGFGGFHYIWMSPNVPGVITPMLLKVLWCHLHATHTTLQWRTSTRWYTCCSVYSFSSNLGTAVLLGFFFFCVAIFKNGGFCDVVALMTHGVKSVTRQCVEACLLIPSNGKPYTLSRAKLSR